MSVWIKTRQGWRPFSKACVNSNDLQGVYSPVTLEQAQMSNSLRADRFLVANGLGTMDKQAYFRGDHFIEPIYGAFGEKL
jgi:hypothetical protein